MTSVLTGLDVLLRDGFAPLAGRRVGLITNHSGLAADGTPNVALFARTRSSTLAALFSPEHGFDGSLEADSIPNTLHEPTGLPVFSLYGRTRRPTAPMLEGLDTLVFDIQDAGTRHYTYISTMGYAMEEAARHGLRFVVLDRPNPINGLAVHGPVLDAGAESFVGYHALALRHGMTIGELARMFAAERRLDLHIEIVAMQGWDRSMFFDETGLPWVNPSPNIRSVDQALLYSGLGFLETTNLSVGRGTERPFEQFGAPWLDGQALAEGLEAYGIAGASFHPVEFTPDASTFAGQRCSGVRVEVADRQRLEPIRLGLALARELRLRYHDQWEAEKCGRLLGSERTLRALLDGAPLDDLVATFEPALGDFRERRARFLLYPGDGDPGREEKR